MSSRLLSGSIAAPGFNGLNTQDSGILLDSGWALTASNCVIDKFGRIGSRRGWTMVTTNKDTLTTGTAIESIFEFKDVDGTYEYLCAGDNKLFESEDATVLSEKHVRNADNTADIDYTITGNDWQWCSLPLGQGVNAVGYAFLAQLGHPMLVYSDYAGHIYRRVGDVGDVPTGFTTATFDPNVLITAYGRIWAAHTTSNKTTVFYSALLDGTDFTGAGSGILDVSAVVGNNDEITALATHNNFLIVFCKNNIVVYSGANDVDNLSLNDTINGVGCVARDSVQSTGTDVLFLSKTGVRALGRTIQEKSMPLRELSLNIRDDLVNWIEGEDLSKVRSIYYERDAFYLLSLPILKQIVCFDMRSPAPNGAAKITVWEDIEHTAFCTTDNRELLVGQVDGIGKYQGSSDNGVSYRVRYYTNYFDLGMSTTLKMLKKIGITVIGQGQSFVTKYSYDYSTNFQSRPLTLSVMGSVSEYGIAEYNIGEYSGNTVAQNVTVNAGGSGKVVQLGFEADIDGEPLSIQKIDLAAVTGKTVI
jgi:hypothetical protein